MSLALHTPGTIFSLRHTPSWLLLAFAAGSVNTTAFFACKRFVTHMTGTATQIGMAADLEQLQPVALLLASFIAGAMASVPPLQGRLHRGKTPLYAAPLLLVAAVLASVALAGSLGAFGAFGMKEEPVSPLLPSLLCFAMGLQNATVATSTGSVVRTTHMTGPACDLGVLLATWALTSGPDRGAALRGALLRGGKLASFILGALLLVPVIERVGFLALLVPAAATLLAACLSFVPAWSSLEAPQLSRRVVSG